MLSRGAAAADIAAAVAASAAAAECNVPESVWERATRRLHNVPHHPLCSLKATVHSFFAEHVPSRELTDCV